VTRVRTYTYHVVDVFTEIPFAGNMLAVFPDAAGLSDGTMQAIARELNLSETSFVLAAEAPGALARVRIFTPQVELPFAGHPTIGTAFVLTQLGRVPNEAISFAFDELIGRIALRLERRADPFVAWLQTPDISVVATLDRAACAAVLGLRLDDLLGDLPPQILSAGNPFLYVPLRDAATVDRAGLDLRALDAVAPRNLAPGVFFFARAAPGTFYSRMLAPLSGVPEDPGTGSATGRSAHISSCTTSSRDATAFGFVNEQGVRMKRRSLVHGIVRVADDATLRTVEVGGSAVKTSDAMMYVPEHGLA